MPATVEIIRILPAILKLFPQLAKIPLIRGRLIPLNNIAPETDLDAARKLNRRFKRKPKEGPADSSMVIIVDEAIKCVEDAGNNNGGVIWEVIKKGAQQLILGGGEENVTEQLLNPIVECIRENALRQDTPRIGHKVVNQPRPAKGHGHGRNWG